MNHKEELILNRMKKLNDDKIFHERKIRYHYEMLISIYQEINGLLE